jgi:hypothetical protein
MELFVILILAVFASENGLENASKCDAQIWQSDEKNPILVKIEAEYVKVNKKSKFIGVTYHKNSSKWRVQRYSSKNWRVYNGYYDDEETAAHASDTLGRNLMKNGGRNHKLNFPDDDIEVYPDKKSKYVGVTYHEKTLKWRAQRCSKNENRLISNGLYDDEKTAARASDTLARKLMAIGEQKLRLNFPDDHTEVHREKTLTSKYVGVSYHKNTSKWVVRRQCSNQNKFVSYGYYENEETAARASDTFAKQLMENGKQKLKLNFPDSYTEVYPETNQEKRKRPTESN